MKFRSTVDSAREPPRLRTVGRKRYGLGAIHHISMAHCLGFASVLAMLLTVHGCVVGPNFRQPAAPAVSNYTHAPLSANTASADVVGGAAQSFEAGSDIPAEWWRLFRSPQLNRLIAEALAKNPDLQAAQAALRVAAENVSAERGFLYPSATAGVSGSRERRLYYVKGQASGIGAPYDLFNTGVSVTYTLDVFGGIRRQVEAYRAQYEYQRFELEATYLALTANVVTAAVQEASLRGQIAATLQLVNEEKDQLSIVQNEYHQGGVSEADLLAQQTIVAQTEATLPPLNKQVEIERDLLRLLAGHFPSEDVGEDFHLESLHLPEDLPVSLPSRLVRQRPDVRAYEALVHQASAEIGVATANMLPQFTIGARIADYASEAVSPGVLANNIVGGLAQPIFAGGTLLHRRRAAIAGYDQALAEYRYTVLVAFQNVADTLHALDADAAAVRADALAEKSAARSLRVAHDQYEGGYIPYLTLLSAEDYYQRTVVTLIQAEALRYADTAALFQALGGGWWNRQDPAPANSFTQYKEQLSQ